MIKIIIQPDYLLCIFEDIDDMFEKEVFDDILKQHNLKLENNIVKANKEELYDFMYLVTSLIEPVYIM